MSNTLLTPQSLTKEAMYLLENNLVLTKLLDNRSSDFANGKTGYTLQIRKPVNFQTIQANDVTSNIRDIVEEKVDLVIDSAPISIPIEVLDSDFELSIQDFSNRILAPAMESLSSKIESVVANSTIPLINNVVNSANFDFAATTAIRTRMNERLAPKDRKMLLTAGQSATLRTDVKALFITPKEAFEDGAIGTVSGMKLYESELLPTHTCGSRVANTAVIRTNCVEGDTTIDLTLAASTTIKKGDTFTVAGCYNVNYYTKDTKSTLYQFTAAADVGAGTSVTVTLTEAIRGPSATGYRQKMSQLPSTSAGAGGTGGNVVFVGAASTASIPQGLVFANNFASVAFVPLKVHGKSVEEGWVENYKGINLRYQKDYSLGQNKSLIRLDVQMGVKVVQPEYACRFLSVA